LAQRSAVLVQLEVTDQDRATRRASRPIDWANESFAISVRAEVGYCNRTDTGCWYEADRPYIETHTPTVRDRLVKAGVRLDESRHYASNTVYWVKAGGGSPPRAIVPFWVYLARRRG